MIHRSLVGTLAFLLAVLLVAQSNPIARASQPRATARHKLFPVTVTDDLGTRVTIPRKPMRIVSLDPRDTETLFALGLEKRIVADGGQSVEGAACCKTRFKYPQQWPSPWGANYPGKSKTFVHIEGGYDAAHPFDLELVVKERPDLVLSLNSGSQLGVLQRMRSLGLKVVVLDPHNLKQIEHDIALVGRATGAVKHARVVLAHIKRRFKAVEARLRRVTFRPRVFYELDDSTGTPYTACKGSPIDQLISLVKAINVAHNACPLASQYAQISTEAVLADNPQVILLGDSNYGTTPQQVTARSGWSVITAVKDNRVYPFDDDLVSREGPREIVGLETLARLLHPAAFAKRSR